MGITNKKPDRSKKRSGLLPHQLSDVELESHLRIFLQRMTGYAGLLGTEVMLLEQLKREQLAFSWLLEMGGRLAGYTAEIMELRQTMKEPAVPGSRSLLKFYDLPRPPVFYPEGGLPALFGKAITLIKTSVNYTLAIGRELGIENLVADNTGNVLKLV